MARFVLVHGAMHGAWCWSKVVPLLQSRGHTVEAIDLPGSGDDQTPPIHVTLDAYADAVARALNGTSEKAILVGHSMGGLAISAGAERAKDRVAKLVYLCALMIGDGDTLASLGRGSAVEQKLEPGAAGPTPDRETAVRMFYSDCSETDIDFAMARVRPQVVQVFSSPLRLSQGRYGRIPRAYIECTNDGTISIDDQRAMMKRVPPHEVVTLASGHSPFFSMPEELVSALEELAASL